MNKEFLAKQFDAYTKIYPAAAKYARPLAHGNFGLIVADISGQTVTKLLLKDTYNSDANDRHLKVMAHEVDILNHLEQNPLNDFHTPKIVDPFKRIDNNDTFIAQYTMTRIPGHSIEWNAMNPGRFSSAEDCSRHFYSVGRLCAQFHKATENAPERDAAIDSLPNYITIPSFVDDEIKQTLGQLNEHYQSALLPGVLHFDLHGGNIICNSDSTARAVIDVGYTAKNSNIYYDFRCIPLDRQRDFAAGYQDVSGIELNMDMMRLTNLAALTYEMQRDHDNGMNDTKHHQRCMDGLNRSVSNLKHLTQ